MRALLSRAVFAAAILAAGPTLAAGHPTHSAAGAPHSAVGPKRVSGDQAAAPLSFVGGMPTLEVTINGKGPFKLGFDTGAVGEADLTEAVVAALGLPRIGQALTTDPSGRNPIAIPLYRLDSLAVGGVEAKGWLATGSPPMRGALASLDGIIGLGAFPGFVVTLDYAAGRFSLQRGALPPADGKRIFAYKDSIPRVPLTVEGRTLEAHLDTGNVRLGLMAPESFVAGLKNRAQARAIGQAHTVNHTIDLFSVDLAGPARIGDVALTADAVGYPSVIPIANVGSPALQGLVVKVDSANHRVMIARGSAAASAVATAKPTFRMGDGTVDGSILRPYDNAWRYTLTDKDGRVVPQGLWSDHLQTTTVDGKPALMRVQGTTFVNGRTSSTVNVFDPKTLQPFSSRQQGVDSQVQSRTFKGSHLTTTRTPKTGEAPVTTDVELPAAPYDFNGGMYGLLLATLPLRPGLSGAFATVEEFDDKPAVDSFRVLGEEDMSAGARGVVRTWKVVSERPGQYRMTFWLSKAAPYIIKLEYKTEASPLVWDWTMI